MDEIEVINNEAEKRFEVLFDDGTVAMITYIRAGKTIIYTHTEVPESQGGKGIAGKMAYAALEFAKANGLRVQAACPYIKKYVSQHPEYHSITNGF
jgi:predicted GNAT family acetyltransferase